MCGFQVGTSTGNNWKFTWQKCADFPRKKWVSSIVEIDGKVYGAGYADCEVHVYDTHKDCWSTLPELPGHSYSSLVAISNRKKLLIIGGIINIGGKGYVSNKVFLWDEKNKEWTTPYPDMPTARCRASCISHGSSVIVAGGLKGLGLGSASRSVEILHIADTYSHWSVVQQLPAATFEAVPLIVNDDLYIVVGYDKNGHSTCNVVSASLPQLLQSKNSIFGSKIWNKLPNMPYSSNSVNHYQGHLIIFSGDYFDKTTKRWILAPMMYVYNPQTKLWSHIAENHIGYLLGVSVRVSENKIFILGGLTGTHDTAECDNLVTTCLLVTITPQ